MKRRQGLILAITGASLWGLSGVSSQFLFSVGIMPVWLVGMRLLLAGLMMLIFAWATPKLRKQVLGIWKVKASRRQLLLFSLFGFLPAQLAFFMTISYSNVATAASLQFLNPLFTIIFCAIACRCFPSKMETSTIFLSLAGTILLVTNGNFGSLVLSPLAIFWGLLSAVGAVFYSVLPKQLLQEYDATVVVGWGMFLGGLPLAPIVFTATVPTMTTSTILNIIFVVIVGTLMASITYIKSLEFLPAATAQMLGSFEPLVATIVCVLALHESFGMFEILGMILIVSVVFIQFGMDKVLSLQK
ncbi:DMT family transporter [Fructilactobacillus sp. Tb1]|uniref:DMT family transporter n=1 Tax=Fructilactobacillus sp. Tb1 TaxID=3422304 RepID=UPI003D2BCE9D